jgi:predicted amidohydrolase
MRVALAQISSVHDVEANLATISATARAAAAQGAELVVFPEAAMYAFGAPLAGIAEPLDGPCATSVQSLARALGVTIVAGMFTPSDDGRVFNTLVVAGPDSVSGYDKIHLFDAFGFQESQTVAPGDTRRSIVVGVAIVGLATCYDIRFPT